MAQLEGLSCDTAALQELAAKDSAIQVLESQSSMDSSVYSPTPSGSGMQDALTAAEGKIKSLSKVLSFNAKVITRLEGSVSQLRGDMEVTEFDLILCTVIWVLSVLWSVGRC